MCFFKSCLWECGTVISVLGRSLGQPIVHLTRTCLTEVTYLPLFFRYSWSTHFINWKWMNFPHNYLDRGGIPLHDAVEVNCNCKQVPGIFAKVFMFDDCVRIIWLDMTTPPWWREQVILLWLLHISFTTNMFIIFVTAFLDQQIIDIHFVVCNTFK